VDGRLHWPAKEVETIERRRGKKIAATGIYRF
jgi:hypothetical protein